MENKDEFIEKWKSEDGDELKRYRAREFIEIIQVGEDIDVGLYFKMIEKMVVFEDKKIIISFLDGIEVECIIE